MRNNYTCLFQEFFSYIIYYKILTFKIQMTGCLVKYIYWNISHHSSSQSNPLFFTTVQIMLKRNASSATAELLFHF